jgi:plastocyanin
MSVEYESKPDGRLWAVVILVAAIVPITIVAELAVPGFQPHIGSSGAPPPSSSSSGGITAVQIIMPNGVSVEHNLNFQPSQITVVVGKNNTITWTNKDSADHTVTFISGPSGVTLASISNPDVGSGQSFTVTLTTPGTYKFHCSFHPAWMMGTIVVNSG